MRAIWKGSISFGLVNIPISLHPATHREELRFRLLREKDLSPVSYRRVAETDGKEVGWHEIVKGYEYEKGKFVVLKEDDFKRVDIEATQTVDIVNFLKLESINPLLFYKPYFMEVSKGGDKAYRLLREALVKSGKIGLARVVIKTRQHLAAVKPQEEGLMLELMHFPDEMVWLSEFKKPTKVEVSKNELQMAVALIDGMTTDWRPDLYQDEYQKDLEHLIQEKIEHGDRAPAKTPARKTPPNVVDLVATLRESLQAQTPSKSKSANKRSKSAPRTRRKAA